MQDVGKIFGNKVRAARKIRGLSQDELALRAEIDRSYMGRIERGEVRITLEKAYKLAATLECDIKELLP